MMFSLETFVELHKDETYAELIETRNELIADIRQFELDLEKEENGELRVIICPSPDVVYQMHLEYLSQICLLIVQRFQEEQENENETKS